MKLVEGYTEAMKGLSEGLDGAPAMPATQMNEQTLRVFKLMLNKQ